MCRSFVESFFKTEDYVGRFDIVHAHDRLTGVAAVRAAKKMKIPVVVHFRDYWVACPRSSCMAPDGFAYEKCTPVIIFKHYPFYRWVWEMYKLFSLRAARKVDSDLLDINF